MTGREEMRSNHVKAAAILLVVVALLVAFLRIRKKDERSSSDEGPRHASVTDRRSGSGASRAPRPEVSERDANRPADPLESAGFGRAGVAVELEPDMEYFQGSGEGLDDAVLADLKAGKLSGEALVSALSALRGTDFEELPLDLSAFLVSEEVQVRRAALAVLAGAGPEGLAKAWEAVRAGTDPLSMLAVMKVAAAKGGKGLAPILKDGISASHPQIRFDAMEMVEPLQGKDERARREVLRAAAGSEHADVAAVAVGQLSYDPRKADLSILFELLDHPDAEVKAAARGSIDFLIDADFSTTAEARAWWESHAREFDDELSPVE